MLNRSEFLRFQQHVHEVAENQQCNDEEDDHDLDFFKVVGGQEKEPEAE